MHWHMQIIMEDGESVVVKKWKGDLAISNPGTIQGNKRGVLCGW